MMTIAIYLLIALGLLVLVGIGLAVLAWFVSKDDEMLEHWEQMQGSLDDE